MAESVRRGVPVPPAVEEAWATVNDPSASFELRFHAAGEMDRLLREFEPVLVKEARRDGATWAEIGEALGITRQAAQQRYG